MAKNRDSKTVNRTGFFNMEDMTITYKDKDSITIFNLAELLKEYDQGNISLTIASDFEPSHVVEE